MSLKSNGNYMLAVVIIGLSLSSVIYKYGLRPAAAMFGWVLP